MNDLHILMIFKPLKYNVLYVHPSDPTKTKVFQVKKPALFQACAYIPENLAFQTYGPAPLSNPWQLKTWYNNIYKNNLMEYNFPLRFRHNIEEDKEKKPLLSIVINQEFYSLCNLFVYLKKNYPVKYNNIFIYDIYMWEPDGNDFQYYAQSFTLYDEPLKFLSPFGYLQDLSYAEAKSSYEPMNDLQDWSNNHFLLKRYLFSVIKYYFDKQNVKSRQLDLSPGQVWERIKFPYSMQVTEFSEPINSDVQEKVLEYYNDPDFHFFKDKQPYDYFLWPIFPRYLMEFKNNKNVFMTYSPVNMITDSNTFESLYINELIKLDPMAGVILNQWGNPEKEDFNPGLFGIKDRLGLMGA